MHPDIPGERYSGSQAAMTVVLMAAAGLIPMAALDPDLKALGTPIGYRKNGDPIYPIAGGGDDDLTGAIDALTARITEMSRYQMADMAAKAGMRTFDPATRQQIVGGGQMGSKAQLGARSPAHAFMKATLGDGYVPGSFITALAQARSADASEQTTGKAALDALGLVYMDVPEQAGKATLGTTGATGGYVLPNNLVDTVTKPAVGTVDWDSLVTMRPGVMVRGVDQPYRTGAPARMTAQDWGATKENVNEAYGSYTANLVTFARIYDVAKQYLRFSAGAAERDVMDELAKAYKLTKEYAILAGPGTGTVGSGDATLGVYTSLAATPTWLAYRSAKTGAASASTIVGSFASACSEVLSLMAARKRFPTAFIVDSITYFAVLAQGSDTAGFWVTPNALGGLHLGSDGGLMFLGVPIRHSPQFNSYTGTTKALIAADWGVLKVYEGSEFRIDSSDVAGSRWDQNLVGFRGEAELGVNAENMVHVGAAQLMTAVIP